VCLAAATAVATPQVRLTKRTPNNWRAVARDLQYRLRRAKTAVNCGGGGVWLPRRAACAAWRPAPWFGSHPDTPFVPHLATPFQYKSMSSDYQIIKLRKS